MLKPAEEILITKLTKLIAIMNLFSPSYPEDEKEHYRRTEIIMIRRHIFEQTSYNLTLAEIDDHYYALKGK